MHPNLSPFISSRTSACMASPPKDAGLVVIHSAKQSADILGWFSMAVKVPPAVSIGAVKRPLSRILGESELRYGNRDPGSRFLERDTQLVDRDVVATNDKVHAQLIAYTGRNPPVT